ncbi:hypothetical protein BH789_gp078 [Gordonia phage GMA6]|uniref:Uncharacterized protein n=1 Tax=Gordonia phage GMA6 TaxID=1647285 RepID=A0A0K0NL77_9CAUD|nr:hypothetical protein BH789_gp078 [Gordonia phage GMA6]AKL88359.1 hypothetical protein GMA6_78 [Gordonia phage GMA6]
MRQEDWNPAAHPMLIEANIGPMQIQAPVPRVIENGKNGPNKVGVAAEAWQSLDAKVRLHACILCGAVVTQNTWTMHNNWHDENKRPVKRVRSTQQKGE